MIRRPFIWFTKDEKSIREFGGGVCFVLAIVSAIWPYVWGAMTDLNTGGVSNYVPELNINGGATLAWAAGMLNFLVGWFNAGFLFTKDHNAVYVFRLDIKQRYPLLFLSSVLIAVGVYFGLYSQFVEWMMEDEYSATTKLVFEVTISVSILGLVGWVLFPTIYQEMSDHYLGMWVLVSSLPMTLVTLYQFDEYGWSALRWALVVWFLLLLWGFGMTNLWSLMGSFFALLVTWIFFNSAATEEYAPEFEDWTKEPSSPPPKQKRNTQSPPPKPPEEMLLLDYFKPRNRKEAAIWRLLNDPAATEGEKQAALAAIQRLQKK